MLGCGLSMLLLVGTWIGAGPLLRLAGAQDDYINLGLQYAFPTLVSLALSGPAIIVTAYFNGMFEVVRHNMDRAAAHRYVKMLNRYHMAGFSTVFDPQP